MFRFDTAYPLIRGIKTSVRLMRLHRPHADLDEIGTTILIEQAGLDGFDVLFPVIVQAIDEAFAEPAPASYDDPIFDSFKAKLAEANRGKVAPSDPFLEGAGPGIKKNGSESHF